LFKLVEIRHVLYLQGAIYSTTLTNRTICRRTTPNYKMIL